VTKYCNIILCKGLLVQGLTFNRKDEMWMICTVTYGMPLHGQGARYAAVPCNAKKHAG